MLERAERASHIDPPASSYAIMQRASPYCGENPGPGKDVRGELEPRPGIRELTAPPRRWRSGDRARLCYPREGIARFTHSSTSVILSHHTESNPPLRRDP